MTETEIALELKVDQSTISRDIKVLKLLSQRFVFDLAKSDLAYYYKQCIDGIEEVRRKGWEIFKGQDNSNLTPRDKLLAVKVIRECNESKSIHEICPFCGASVENGNGAGAHVYKANS